MKVRPQASEDYAAVDRIVCLRGEDCSLQLIITATGGDCRDAALQVSAFASGKRTIAPERIRMYRQGFLNVLYRTSVHGDTGEWPDPLIPAVDPEVGEPRRAFPVDVRQVSPVYRGYRAHDGRAVAPPAGSGSVEVSGVYTSAVPAHYVLEIVRPGAVGVATFRWRMEPGAAQRSSPRITSSSAGELDAGLQIAFTGNGVAGDFRAGEEFHVYAAPARRQPVWVDVNIPADAPPGQYQAIAQATFSNHPTLAIPVTLEVLPLAVPSAPAFANWFGFYGRGAYQAHYGFGAAPDRSKLLALGQAYARAALRNGITLAGAEEFAPRFEFSPDGRLLRADYSEFAAAFGPFLDGSTATGARWSALRLPRFSTLSETQMRAALPDFVSFLRQRGWLDRTFDYTADEPRTPEDFAALRRRAATLQAAAPAIPRLATTDLRADLVGVVTRWCPLLNALLPTAESWREAWRTRDRPSLSAYGNRIAQGDAVWWYISCEGHGCGSTGRYPATMQWPSFVVDAPGPAARVLGLLTAMTPGISGLLYWDTAYAHHHDAGERGGDLSPWDSLYYFGGNGEGSLFYPGTPERIGGTLHIPIESLRMKFLRDSLVDAALVRLLEQRGEHQFVRQQAALVLRAAHDWSDNAADWVALREALARRAAAGAN